MQPNSIMRALDFEIDDAIGFYMSKPGDKPLKANDVQNKYLRDIIDMYDRRDEWDDTLDDRHGDLPDGAQQVLDIFASRFSQF